jgi:hypothetical protein
MKTSLKIIVSATLLLAFVISVADARIFLGPGQTLGTTPAQLQCPQCDFTDSGMLTDNCGCGGNFIKIYRNNGRICCGTVIPECGFYPTSGYTLDTKNAGCPQGSPGFPSTLQTTGNQKCCVVTRLPR